MSRTFIKRWNMDSPYDNEDPRGLTKEEMESIAEEQIAVLEAFDE